MAKTTPINPADDTRRNRKATRTMLSELADQVNEKITQVDLKVADLEMRVRNLETPNAPKEL